MNKGKKLHFLLVLLAMVTGIRVSAQDNPVLTQALGNLQRQAVQHPFEKVYLQLDKPYYAAGDTIWLKAYDVEGSRHRLSLISNVLNVDLIDQFNNITSTIKLPLTRGTTYGSINLPDSLSAGSYRVRAYTNWMRNSGPAYFFDKTIIIFNPIINKVLTKYHYSTSVQNNKQTVSATLSYKDLDGKPYASQEVKYEIHLLPQHIARGKGVTDAQGNLHISFVNPQAGAIMTGNIITTLNMGTQTAVKKNIPIKLNPLPLSVQFFPESGSLVNGLTSKVAFKAVALNGLGADVKGTVTDEQNNIVATFSSTHLGMGTFMLTPQAGKSYKANVVYQDSIQSTVPLPKALDKGYVLSIDNSGAQEIKLVISEKGFENDGSGITIVAQSGGEVYVRGKGAAGKTTFSASITKGKLPSGIVQFTLFSDSGEPLNERLVYVGNPDRLTLAVNSNQQSYTARQKAGITLHAQNSDNQPVQGNFSVSVVNESMVPVDEDAESTIFTNLLLTSDIAGYVEKPGYYFNNPSEKTKADLDLLMLTQGYHRYEWKQFINKPPAAFQYQPEKAVTINGYLKAPNDKPVPHSKVTLVSYANGTFAADTLSDKNGKFTFNIDFPDSTSFTLRAADSHGSDVQIELDNNQPEVGYNIDFSPAAADIDFEAYLANSSKRYTQDIKNGTGGRNIMLKAVNIKETVRSEKQMAIDKAVEFSSNLNGKGNADQVVTSAALEEKGCTRLADCLAGVLVNITFNSQGVPFLNRSQMSLTTGRRLPMTIVLDGIYTDALQMNNLNLDDISAIEVLRSAGNTAMYGTRGAGGVLIITTKHGANSPDKRAVQIIQPKGFYKVREFYSPQYDHPAKNAQLEDLRTTIYWSPMVKTDDTGNAVFQYFNADNKGTYRVTIEGIDDDGNLGRTVYRYKVE